MAGLGSVIGLSGGEGGMALTGPSSSSAGTNTLSSPFEVVSGSGERKEETPYVMIAAGIVAAAIAWKVLR